MFCFDTKVEGRNLSGLFVIRELLTTRPSDLKLERFVEALSDPSSDLTYPALVGSRKQSVIDAERFFGPNLAKFMQDKG